MGASERFQSQSLLPVHSYFIVMLTARALGVNGKVGESQYGASALILHCLAGSNGREKSFFLTAFAQTFMKDGNNEFGPQS